MLHNTHLKNRLPSWNLLFLALVLSGGVFFGHTARQQQLIDHIDDQLLSTARNIAFFYETTRDRIPVQKSLCESLPGFSPLSSHILEMSLYSSQGKMLCSSGDHQTSLPKHHLADSTIHLETTANPQGYLRTLIFPIEQQGSPLLYLSINSDLSGLQKRASKSTLILFLLGIIILTLFAALQRKFRNRDLSAIKQLTLLMDRTNTEMRPSTFEVAKTAKPEVHKLANSYNEMMTRRANNLRRARQFTADVTHELRTPLTILRGETELALRNGRDKDQLRQVLVSNLEEISRMSYLIEDLLLLSKGDLGQIPLKMEPQHLNELIVELHHQAQLLATTKNIGVKLHFPEEQIHLQADSLRLRQVFLNLLTNAIKYTPENGNVSITVAKEDENVAITISDTGIGMDSTHLESIFDRFYRVDKTGNRNDGGSGLGLAIVKWIVDAHQGSITVSSIPGEGSNFTVHLPLSQK